MQIARIIEKEIGNICISNRERERAKETLNTLNGPIEKKNYAGV